MMCDKWLKIQHRPLTRCVIAIRNFALQDWTERNLIALMVCASNTNASDMFTKQVGKSLHVIMITFPAKPHYFGLILDLLLVPNHRLGPGGGSVFPADRPDLLQPHSKSIA
jgi:hypothetical protein